MPGGAAAARHRRARAARDVLAGAGTTSRGPPSAPPFRGLFLAGDWIDTGLPATIESAVRSGHRAADARLRRRRSPLTGPDMTSIVVHYKELALKGKNRPWFVQILVRNMRTALAGIDVPACAR